MRPQSPAADVVFDEDLAVDPAPQASLVDVEPAQQVAEVSFSTPCTLTMITNTTLPHYPQKNIIVVF